MKLLETETLRLRENIEDSRNKLTKGQIELEAADSELTVYADKVKEMSSKEVELKKFIKQQVNKFLEHNLKENGEMLASLANLYEEGRVMKARNVELEDQLQMMTSSTDMSFSSSSQDTKALPGKYLRADSFRKALIWQKRYLLVLIGGEALTTEPVFPVTRDYRLAPLARFRAAVHGVTAVIRMRFLVKRWRTGKRAGAYLPTTGTPTTPR